MTTEEISYRGNNIIVKDVIKDAYMLVACIAFYGILFLEEYSLFVWGMLSLLGMILKEQAYRRRRDEYLVTC